jgi:hypothetical protein
LKDSSNDLAAVPREAMSVINHRPSHQTGSSDQVGRFFHRSSNLGDQLRQKAAQLLRQQKV